MGEALLIVILAVRAISLAALFELLALNAWLSARKVLTVSPALMLKDSV